MAEDPFDIAPRGRRKEHPGTITLYRTDDIDAWSTYDLSTEILLRLNLDDNFIAEQIPLLNKRLVDSPDEPQDKHRLAICIHSQLNLFNQAITKRKLLLPFAAFHSFNN